MKRGIDFIGVGVGAILVDDRGQLFLARRGPQAKNERGLWEFPGGSVEFGEKLTQALAREMREEYGVEIAVGACVAELMLDGRAKTVDISPFTLRRFETGALLKGEHAYEEKLWH